MLHSIDTNNLYYSMVCKRFKSSAAASLLKANENINYINPATNRIDIKSYAKHLCEKDETADYEINVNPLIDSSDSECMLLKNVLDSSSESDSDLLNENNNASSSKSPKKGSTLLAPST